jgi:zinc protease
MPTAEPFMYTISMAAREGTPLRLLEEAALTELDRVRTGGVTGQEVERARTQLRARLVFENDSITNIAHQLGYFDVVASWTLVSQLRARIEAVTDKDVSAAAAELLVETNRTVGWFEPRG